MLRALTLLTLAASALAQQPGPYTPEVHPKLASQVCTRSGGCKNVSSSVVLDSAYRWLHTVDGYDACQPDGSWNKTICPDVETCAAACAIEGADYPSLGVKTSGNSLTLNLFVDGNSPSPRVYLLGEDENSYEVFKLLNKEFTFDVDTSKVPCGINGALYFSEMDGKGSANDLNKAGAKYGTGYCDAQCPTVSFIDGEANLNNTYGACCNEMDIWEANSAAIAFTPHPCTEPGVYKCEGDTCGNEDRYGGVCDKDGCDFNHYRQGARGYYGPGKTVDTTKPFTVVTQFLTNDNTTTGTLSEIRRLYIQNGTVINNSKTNVTGLKPYDSISDEYCTEQKKVFDAPDDFADQGGMAGMGGALDRGMVLAMSIWQDAGGNMLWLDGVQPAGADPDKVPGAARGPCGPDTGKPEDNASKYSDAAITWSNIRSGEIGSTFKASRYLR